MDLRSEEPEPTERVRRPGAGRKPLSETDASLTDDLRALVEPQTRGDPQSPLKWTCKSLRKLSAALRYMGHRVGRTVVGELLRTLGYSLQANRKMREGSNHPDRDAQFRYSAFFVSVEKVGLGAIRRCYPSCFSPRAPYPTAVVNPAECKLDSTPQELRRSRLCVSAIQSLCSTPVTPPSSTKQTRVCSERYVAVLE
jgi:hypothetical protein